MRAYLALAVSLFVACSGEDSSSRRGDADASDIIEVFEVQVGEELTFPEAIEETDATEVEAEVVASCETDPGRAMCPCDDSSDCNSDYCVPVRAGGKLCTSACGDSGCPDGWECSSVRTQGRDLVFICLEIAPNLCRPCTNDAQCQAGAITDTADRCVRGEGRVGSFCGVACVGATDLCPGDTVCREVVALEGGATTFQCVPESGECECSGRAIEEDAFTACNDRTCTGMRTCTEFGLSACDARPWSEEICDGRDNDCNDAIDDGFLDSDADGMADCIDPDDDDDTIPDLDDNCPLLANTDQLDNDDDGLGDVCDPDDDDDTVLDGDDNCPLIANTDQADSDDDGQGDACDTVAPMPPTLAATDPLSPSNDDGPTVIGTAESGATITLYLDDCLGPALATGPSDGTFAIAVTVPHDAVSTLFGTATDGAGNVSECSEVPLVYSHDGTAPPVPVLLATDPSSPSKTSLTPNISGTGQETIRLYLNTCSGTPITTGVAAAGTFALTGQASANAVTVFVADAIDAVGNASGCSLPLSYTHDTVAPQAPLLISTEPPSPSNSDLDPIIHGSAEALSTIQLYTAPQCTTPQAATATVDANGVFVITGVATANATTTFYARATDRAGNVSPCSNALPYVHDATRPSKPVLVSTVPGSPSSSTTPQVRGTADAGTTVRLYTDACVTTIGQPVTVAADRSFSVATVVAANATTTFRARATNGVGTLSDCSDPLAYVSDSQPPAAPVLTSTTPPSPSSVQSPTLNGTSEVGVTVRIFAAASCGGSPIATFGPTSVTSFARVVDATANTTTTFSASATDAAGNTSVCSTSLAYVHDGQAPSAPALTGTTPASPSTSSTTPAINGTTEAGTTVALFNNGTCSGSAVATLTTAPATFAINTTVTANSTTTFSANATDALGNASACSNAITYVHAVAGPTAPSITSSNPSSPGSSLTPALSGTAPVGTTVTLFMTQCTGSPIASGSAAAGTFTITVPAVTSGSTTTFYAQATDASSNVSPCSAGFGYTHQPGAPPKPTITSSNPVSPSNNQAPTLTGNATEVGLTVEIFAQANCQGTVVATGASTTGGAFTIANVPALNNAVTSFSARSRNGAGPNSLCSDPFAYRHALPVGTVILKSIAPNNPSTTTAARAVGTTNQHNTVYLYLSSDCSGSPVNPGGTLMGTVDFEIDFTANSQQCTAISAKARGPLNDESPCSNSLTFAHYNCTQCACSNEDWIRQIGTSAVDLGVAATVADQNGEAYIVGTTSGSLYGTQGGSDVFITGFGTLLGNDTPGNTRLQFGSSANDLVTAAVASDESVPQYIYVAGWTEGDIDPTGATTPPTNRDAWIAKISDAGVIAWIRRYDSPRTDTAVDLVYDQPAARLYMLIESNDGGIRSPRVVRVALADGAFTDFWNDNATAIDTSATGITIDTQSSVYVQGRAAFALSGAVSTNGIAGGGAYVRKLSMTGGLQWTTHWGSAGDDQPANLAFSTTSVSVRGVYAAATVSAQVVGSADAHAGLRDVGYVYLDRDTGAQIWARNFGTAQDEVVTAIAANGTGANGSVHLLGYTYGALGASRGGADVFLVKIDRGAGAPGAFRQFGTSADDISGAARITGGFWYVPATSQADWTGQSRDACTYDGLGDAVLARFCLP